jgi:hypothetical protein
VQRALSDDQRAVAVDARPEAGERDRGAVRPEQAHAGRHGDAALTEQRLDGGVAQRGSVVGDVQRRAHPSSATVVNPVSSSSGRLHLPPRLDARSVRGQAGDGVAGPSRPPEEAPTGELAAHLLSL